MSDRRYRNGYRRPILAGIVAFLLLLATLYCLARAGSHIGTGDVFGAAAISTLVAAIVGAVGE